MKVLVPLRRNVIFRQVKPDDITKGGLVLPNMAQKEKNIGTALYIGEDVTSVAVGDTFVFSGYAAVDIEFNNEQLLMVDEESILAVEREIPGDNH